jgi:Sec-independent protein translocase protein TatA
MDILGVGGWELVAIILIMLVVAGPKRMIQWSYTLGKYVAVLRKMWSETAQMLQKEFDEAGVDVKVPKDIPTRASIGREINRALTPVTKPLQETLDATKNEINTAKKAVSLNLETATEATKPVAADKPAEAKPVEQPKPAAPEASPAPTPSTNGHQTQDFGTWSQKSEQ